MVNELKTVYFGYDICPKGSRGSSVSIVFGYGLDDREIEVRSPAEAKDFSSSLCVQNRGPPSVLSSGYCGFFPRGKARQGRDADHSPHPVPSSRMTRSYTSSPPAIFNINLITVDQIFHNLTTISARCEIR
jgi:hypothetical protein